jgi:hypothetical protein
VEAIIAGRARRRSVAGMRAGAGRLAHVAHGAERDGDNDAGGDEWGQQWSRSRMALTLPRVLGSGMAPSEAAEASGATSERTR